MDPNAAHIERLVAYVSCTKVLQEDLQRCRRNKLFESAQRRYCLKECRRDLRDHTTLLSAQLKGDGTPTSSRREMESVTEKFYTKDFCPSIYS